MDSQVSIDTLLRYAKEVEDFIFGKFDTETLLRTEGFGARPTQQDKDKFVAAYGKKINIVQMAVKKIKERATKGIIITEKEQQLVSILDRINKEYPAQRRRDILDIAINFDKEIRGTLNVSTGMREGGLNRRPSKTSKNTKERALEKDLWAIYKAVKRIRQSQAEGKNITDRELKIIEIYQNFCNDYPKISAPKSSIENMQDIVVYIRGDEEIVGIKRRPRENSTDPIEKSMYNKLHNIEKKVVKLKEESKKRALSNEEKLLIELLDDIDLEFPKMDKNTSMIDSVKSLDKYIRGGYDELTKIDYPGIKRRPSEILAKTDEMERKFLGYFRNGYMKAKKLTSTECQLSFDEAELVEIMTALCEDYPKKNADMETAVRILTGYIYEGIDKKDGTIIEAVHKRPATSSVDELERKMANKLCAIQNRIASLATNNVQYDDIEESEFIGIEFLHKLDMDYPSQKKTRTNTLKYCDKILQIKAKLEKNEKISSNKNDMVYTDSEDLDAGDR